METRTKEIALIHIRKRAYLYAINWIVYIMAGNPFPP